MEWNQYSQNGKINKKGNRQRFLAKEPNLTSHYIIPYKGYKLQAMSKKARYNGTTEPSCSDAIFDDDLRWCVMLVDLIARETLVKRRINIGGQRANKNIK